MQAVYHTSVDELNLAFINNLKKQFQKAKVDIFVREMDETQYLNSSKTNKKLLEKAIKEVDENMLLNKTLSELSL